MEGDYRLKFNEILKLNYNIYWKIERVELGGTGSGSCQIGNYSTGGIEYKIAYYRRD
jgi:hypothetical protein